MTSIVPEDFPQLNWANVGVDVNTWESYRNYKEISHIQYYLLTPIPAHYSKREALHYFRALIDENIKASKAETPNPTEKPKKSKKVPPTLVNPLRATWLVVSTFVKGVQCLLPVLSVLAAALLFLYGWWCNMPKFDIPKPERSNPAKPTPGSSFPDCCDGFRGTGKIPMPKLIRQNQRLAGFLGRIPGLTNDVLKLGQGVHGLLVVTRVLKVSNGMLAKDIAKIRRQVVNLQGAIQSVSKGHSNVTLVGLDNSTVSTQQWAGPLPDDHEAVLELTERMDATEKQVAVLDARSRTLPACVPPKELERVKTDSNNADREHAQAIAQLSSQIIHLQNIVLKHTDKQAETMEREIRRHIYDVLNVLALPGGLLLNRLTELEAAFSDHSRAAIRDSAKLAQFIKAPPRAPKQAVDAAKFSLELCKHPHFASMASLREWFKQTPTLTSFDPIGIMTSYPQLAVQLVYWTPLRDYLPEKWMVSIVVSLVSYMAGRRRHAPPRA